MVGFENFVEIFNRNYNVMILPIMFKCPTYEIKIDTLQKTIDANI